MIKTFKKENLLNALAKGAINLLKLQGADNYLLAIITKDSAVLVPCIKNEAGAYAYVPTSVDLKDYSLYDDMIKSIFENSVYADMYSYKPIQRDIEVIKIVEGFIPPSGIVGVKADNLEEVLVKAGYDTSALSKTVGIKEVVHDYSHLLADPEVKERFDENRKSLEAVGATFEDLDLETKMSYDGLMTGSLNGIIFAGPTGTGKSFAARILADHANAPLLTHQISYGTAVEDLIGMFIPNDNASADVKTQVQQIWKEEIGVQDKFDRIVELINNRGESGNWRFASGPLMLAATKGFQLCLEEVNFGQPGIISKINEFTDTTLYFTLNGEVYKKHPNFVVYMTMNPGYKGTEELNMALKNRFVKVNIPQLTKEEFSKRARFYSKSLGHELSSKFFDKLYDFAAFIKNEGNSSRWHENVEFSIRNAHALCNEILKSPRSFDEFKAAVATAYINDLSMDNDNSEKLKTFKADETVVNQIRDLYNLYDFMQVEGVKVEVNFEELFSEVEEAKAEDSIGDEMLDDLFGKMGS